MCCGIRLLTSDVAIRKMTVLAIETRDELLSLRHSHFVLQSFHIFCDKFGSMRSTIQLDAGVLVGGNLFNTSLQ
jgi:hypothetical protein